MAHLEKYARGATGHLFGHYDRSVGERNGNQDIKHELTELNYNLADSIQPKGQLEFVDQRLSEVKVQNRKDVIFFCDWVVTAPKNLKDEDEEKFFKATFDLLAERYGKENIISAYVHKDEARPHLHFAFLPIVQDKNNPEREKLCAKECVNRTDLRTFHGHLNEHIKITLGYEVAILNGATSKGNKQIIELKTETAQETLENTLNKLTDAQANVSACQDEITSLKIELEAYKTLETQRTAIDKQSKSFLGITTLKTKDFVIIKDQALTYTANAEPLDQAQSLHEKNKSREKQLDNRKDELDNREQMLNTTQKEQEARHQRELEQMQANINYQNQRILSLEADKGKLLEKMKKLSPPLDSNQNYIFFNSQSLVYNWYRTEENIIFKYEFTAEEVVELTRKDNSNFFAKIQDRANCYVADYDNVQLYEEFKEVFKNPKSRTNLNDVTA
ncbi:MAG: MobV family relaxase, partial [Clostridia bacterium]